MFCLSAAAAVRSGLQLTAVTRWAPLMSTAVLQRGDSYLQPPLSPLQYQRLAGPRYKLYFLFPSQAPLPGLGIQSSGQPQWRRKIRVLHC